MSNVDYGKLTDREIMVLTASKQEEMLRRLDRLEGCIDQKVNPLQQGQARCDQWRENHERSESNRLIIWGFVIAAISIVSSISIALVT